MNRYPFNFPTPEPRRTSSSNRDSSGVEDVYQDQYPPEKRGNGVRSYQDITPIIQRINDPCLRNMITQVWFDRVSHITFSSQGPFLIRVSRPMYVLSKFENSRIRYKRISTRYKLLMNRHSLLDL